MNAFDVVLLVLLGVLMIAGLWKGMIRILVGLGALVAALAVAALWQDALAPALAPLGLPEQGIQLLAYAILFAGTLVAGGLLAWLLRRLMRAARLSWLDRLAGAALGLVVALLVAAWSVSPLVAYSPAGRRVLESSVLAPYVAAVADLACRAMPDALAAGYRRGVEDLRERWRDRRDARAGAPQV